jgi:hypothetical protein
MSKSIESWITALAKSTGKTVEEAQRELWESGLFYGLKSGETFRKSN